MQNLKKPGTIKKVTPKKPKVKYLIFNNICTKLYSFFQFQAYLSELEKEYHGISNEDCIRINKTEGGKFCIKIPTSKTGSDYLVVTKYKTTDMNKVEQKDR